MARPTQPLGPETLDGELAAIFAETRQRAYWIALDITGDSAEAADLTGEALLRVQKALPRFRGDCSLRGYLLRTVVNLSLKAVRRKRVRARLRHLFLGEERAQENPEQLAGSAERVSALLRALEELPAQQRAAFLLRHGHGLSVAEVGEVLELAEGTVKTHLRRAVLRLREHLKEIA